MLLLAQTDGFSLFHDPLRNWLYAIWAGSPSAGHLRQHYRAIKHQARRLQCLKLLNDSTADSQGWQVLASWLADDCLTELARSGVQAVAWVLPAQPQVYQELPRLLALPQDLLLDVFTEVEAAHTWLLKWPN